MYQYWSSIVATFKPELLLLRHTRPTYEEKESYMKKKKENGRETTNWELYKYIIQIYYQNIQIYYQNTRIHHQRRKKIRN